MDRRLWTPEVFPLQFRKTIISRASSPSWALKSGHLFLNGFALRLSSNVRASNVVKGVSGPIQMVQPPQSRNQQRLLEPEGRESTLWVTQAARQQMEDHIQAIPRQVAPSLSRTDNSIKNHFYSTIRRCLRRINKLQGEKNSTLKMRTIKPYVLSKILADRGKTSSMQA